MISISEAWHRLEENLPGRTDETVGLVDAHGRYLAEDMRSTEASPRYSNSAMDGYAVVGVDVTHAGPRDPVALRVIGESMAGVPFAGSVGRGEAVQISSGAMIPEGMDTVVRVEDTERAGEWVKILAPKKIGHDVRLAGEEFQAGEMLLSKGTRLSTRQLALLAAIGCSDVRVYALPQVALLVTGEELVGHGGDLKPFQIHDANTTMLKNAVTECGGSVISHRSVGDDLEQTVLAMEQMLAAGPDIVLCSGGVSVGRHDHVKAAAGRLDFQELFWKIRQKPGKPFFAAKRKNMLFFGLPGNPVSAFMCFAHYVAPILGYLHGQPFVHRPIMARTSKTLANEGDRTNFCRVKIEHPEDDVPVIREVRRQGSHMLTSIVHADGYVILAPGEILKPNALKEVYRF